MKLVTVKEYAKKENISDQGVRKRIASGLVDSVQLRDNIFIVVDDTSAEIIKDLKAKIRLLNSNIRTYKEKVVVIQHREDYVDRLEKRVDMLETKFDEAINKRDELYEKVINTLMLPSA